MSTAAWDDLFSNHVDDVAARPAHRLPKLGDGVSAPTLLVHLHHPGYRDTNQSILFTLPTCSINSEHQPCADYWLAWQGCYALAIERKGFFTTRPQRNSTKVAHGQGLVEGHYWYHLDNQDEQDPYATLQSFAYGSTTRILCRSVGPTQSPGMVNRKTTNETGTAV